MDALQKSLTQIYVSDIFYQNDSYDTCTQNKLQDVSIKYITFEIIVPYGKNKAGKHSKGSS